MITLHVEPNGTSTATDDGTEVFHSLEAARDAIRKIKADRGLPPGGITVTLHGGVYRLDKPLVLTAADSGTPDARIIYQAAAGEAVRITGGVTVKEWGPVTDPDVLARLPESARRHVRVADLRAQGITDYGELESAPVWAHSDPGLELFCNGQRLRLSRFPKAGYLYIDTVDECDGEHPHQHIPLSSKGRFRIRQEKGLDTNRLQRWQAEPHVMCHGYWCFDWADQHYRVNAIAPETAGISLDDETYPHSYGFLPGQWFYAYNLLCELDAPGEWFLDRQQGLLYVIPPEGAETGDMAVSIVRDPLQLDAASHITLRGFTLDVLRGSGIHVRGGESVQLEGCTIRNVGQDGIRVDGGRRHLVSDCTIHDTGDGGIYLSGGDRCTLEPAGHEAVNNHVFRISRWNPLYHVGIQLSGVGNRAAHNRVHDVPHIGIGFTGNDQTVEYNEIYRAVYQANDAGAIYTSGAHPEDWSMRGHAVRHNYLHHIVGFRGEGCDGVYLDDMFSGTAITGNLFYRVSHPVFVGGGRDVHIVGNILVESAPAIHIDDRATNWAARYLPEVLTKMREMPIYEEPWASRYPELAGADPDDLVLPKGNRVERNICWQGRWDEIAPLAAEHACIRDNLIGVDPCFADAARCDFRLKPESPAWKLGFEALPLERIGLQRSAARLSVPPREVLEGRIENVARPTICEGRCIRTGIVETIVRNVGDMPYSGRVRVWLEEDGAPDGEGQLVQLAPFEECRLRFAVGTAVFTRAVVLADRHEGELATGSISPRSFDLTDWPKALRVSPLLPGGDDLSGLAALPATLDWHEHATDPENSFCNLHPELATVGEADATVFIGRCFQCAEPMRVAVRLGYDGPVKVFMDGVPVFHDPAGDPPAQPDQVAPECELAAGRHEVVVALGAGRGTTWGIFLRLARTDCDAERAGTTILPEWIV